VGNVHPGCLVGPSWTSRASHERAVGSHETIKAFTLKGGRIRERGGSVSAEKREWQWEGGGGERMSRVEEKLKHKVLSKVLDQCF
jgi:hypothetical protein